MNIKQTLDSKQAPKMPSLLKPEDFAPISELGLRFHMAPDADAPGETLFLQLQELALRSGLTLHRLQLPPGCKDYSDYYLKIKRETL